MAAPMSTDDAQHQSIQTEENNSEIMANSQNAQPCLTTELSRLSEEKITESPVPSTSSGAMMLSSAAKSEASSNLPSSTDAAMVSLHVEKETASDLGSELPQVQTTEPLEKAMTSTTGSLPRNLRTVPEVPASFNLDEHQSTSKHGTFSIDTSLIPSVPNQMQATELQGLEGISVFNQEAFEKGVLEQVDQALSVRQQEVDKERAEKELNKILPDIRACKRELGHLDKVLASMTVKPAATPATFSEKEKQRNLISIRTKRSNKAKQVKILQARQRSLLAKLSGSDVNLRVSDNDIDEDDSSLQTYQQLLCRSPTSDGTPAQLPPEESEQERLIRLGEMTPFGSRVPTTEPSSSQKPRPSPQPLTDFEKFMTGKIENDMMRRKKKVAHRKTTPVKLKPEVMVAVASSSKSKAKKKKVVVGSETETAKRKMAQTREGDPHSSPDEDGAYFVYKPIRKESSQTYSKTSRKEKIGRDLRPNWGEDGAVSGDNDDMSEESDEDYEPGFEDFEQQSDDEEYRALPKKSTKRRGRKLRVATDDVEDGTVANLDALKKTYGASKKQLGSFRKPKCKDDATQDLYFSRLKDNRMKKLRNKQRHIERGETESDSEPEDMQFDDGITIPGYIWSKLYKYQKVGVKWLWELHQQQAGGIVGDEMGLGKTIQMIAFLAGLKESKIRSNGSMYTGLGPVLIVCPATVMHQWVKEFHKWYPTMRVAVLHDSGSHTGSKKTLIRDLALNHGTLITSYSGVRIQERLLLRHQWHYVILDEGHKIRNPDAAVTLTCKQFRTPHRLILSGSPMQNNLRELWSLIDFVFPGKLGTLPVFMEKFSVPITLGGYSNATEVLVQTAYKCACVLRDTINPYLLRRMKEDVKQNLQLPEKSEQVLFCRLSKDQIELYKEYLSSKECQLILNREYQVFAGLITLRKICNHCDLVSGGPRIIRGDSSAEAIAAANDPAMQYGYWERSGKMIVLVSLLKLWYKQENRVLLFSQSKQMLDIIEDYVKGRYSYLRMDGSTTIASRQPLIQQYNNDKSVFVFLLTTRVGGLGVNLTGANRVIIFDPDWNPSTDTQARERAWRIGQTRQVTIYRLITAGTIEEKIYHRQIFKQFLSNRILKDPRQRRFFKSNDLFELFTLTSDCNKFGTETSAIFSGIGSDVRVATSVKNDRRKDKDVNCARSSSDKMQSPVNNVNQNDGFEDTPGCSYSQPDETGSGSKARSENEERRPVSDPGALVKGQGKRKKRKKDARLDGHRIAHLAKHAMYEPKTAGADQQTDSQKDDYVLRKLFKKSGVHSALQHDNIMDADNPDYVLVEGEANRIAKDAVIALRESRRHCLRASSGVPSWTGSAGSSAVSSRKPRFGRKSNVKVASLQKSSREKRNNKKMSPTTTSKLKHFSGKELIETAASSQTVSKADALPPSKALLSRMNQRNLTTDTTSEVSPEQQELLRDMQTFVSFQGKTWGRATTDEILQKFRSKLPANSSALFKAMLNQICTFQRVNDGEGVWKLKTDFQ